MDVHRLELLVRASANVTREDPPVVQFIYREVMMALVTNTRFDRMRIVAPIIEIEEMTEDQLMAVLEANYHTALDARYASSDGVLYAAFIHPLSPLTDGEFQDALGQVASLVRTFGSTYSSGSIRFGR